MTTRYYHTHPRQFANECIYVRTVTEAERRDNPLGDSLPPRQPEDES